MNAFTALPAQFRWTADALADAVPRRLSTLFAVDATALPDCTAAANAPLARLRRGDIAASRLPAGALPARVSFR